MLLLILHRACETSICVLYVYFKNAIVIKNNAYFFIGLYVTIAHFIVLLSNHVIDYIFRTDKVFGPALFNNVGYANFYDIRLRCYALFRHSYFK